MCLFVQQKEPVSFETGSSGRGTRTRTQNKGFGDPCRGFTPLRKRLLDHNQLTDMSNVLHLRAKSMKPFAPQKGHTSFALRAAYL